ncbi:Lipin/Ned1/Smp2-domain-containing protein [Gaertneriomyces semiglobifer]|nr:Lipin/Ned1/Smp2-domain-containing protein [Gaertneriomyces semiglobifer]
MTSAIAFAAGKVVSAVSAVNAFYSEVNPATLSGAIDVVVVQYPDGELVCSPFHVRFGKLKLLRPHDKTVEVYINGQKTNLLMKVGEAGEAFFVVETENPVPSEYATSPIQHPQVGDGSMEELDLNAVAISDEQSPAVISELASSDNRFAAAYPSPDLDKDRLLEPPQLNEPMSSKASTQSSTLPLDAEDVARSFPADARLLGIDTPSKNAKRLSGTALRPPLREASLSADQLQSVPTQADSGANWPSKASSKGSDLPIDADTVAHSFASDAELVGMVQGKDDANPSSDGVVVTAPPGEPDQNASGMDAPDTTMGPGEAVENHTNAQSSHLTKIDEVAEAEGDRTSPIAAPPAISTDQEVPSVDPAAEENLLRISVPVDDATPELAQIESLAVTPAEVANDPMYQTAKVVSAAIGSQVPSLPLHVAISKTKAQEKELEKPKLQHSTSLPFAAESTEKRRGHSRTTSLKVTATDPLESVDEDIIIPGSYVKRANTGPLSDTEIEYTDVVQDTQRAKGWGWKWGTLPKSRRPGEELDNRISRDRTKSADPLSSMSVDEKVNTFLATLPTPSSPDNVSSPTISPVTPESPEEAVTSGSPEHASIKDSNALTNLVPLSFAFNSNIRMEVSLAGYDAVVRASEEEKDKVFGEHVVDFETFRKNPDLLVDSRLVLKINENYYTWAMAGPMIVANLAFGRPLPEEQVQQLHRRRAPSADVAGDNKRYSWLAKSWWSRSGSVRAPATATDKMVEAGVAKPTPVPIEPVAVPVVKLPATFAKSLRLTSEQLKDLNLRKGPNTITFTVHQGAASVTAKLFLYDIDCKIVISDIDGTITKSDALGHIFTMVGKDWTHSGIANLYTNIRSNGYHILYLTSRAIGQASTTRDYLAKVQQDGYQLPEGPVIMSPDRLFASFHREVILRKPEEFKMACLRDIRRLFSDKNPFYAGFGNRITDAMSYRSVDVPASRIFTIDPAGEIKLELLANYKSSYIKLNDIVDQIFPPVSEHKTVIPEYNDWNFWRMDVPRIDVPGEEDVAEELDRLVKEEVEEEDSTEITEESSDHSSVATTEEQTEEQVPAPAPVNDDENTESAGQTTVEPETRTESRD